MMNSRLRLAARPTSSAGFNIWKDADPDVPVYRQAKAEYAQLTKLGNQGR
jgi:hypothetical protein